MKDDISNTSTPSSFRCLLQTAAGWYIVLLTFLLPLKFGSLAAMPEAAGFFPSDCFSWLIINWPAHSFGIFSAFALLAALSAFKLPKELTLRGLTLWFWCLGLPLAGFAGMIHSHAPFYAETETAHLTGCAAFCAAAGLLLSSPEKERWKMRLYGALAFGTFLLCIAGLRQYFFGFAEMREFITSQQAQGVHVSGVMLAKTADTRVYSTMVSANVLAGFLLLSVPLAVMVFRYLSRFFEPEKISRPLFTLIMLLPGITVFLMSKTRAAFLCALVTLGIFFFSLKIKKIWKFSCGVLLLLTIICGTLYIRQAGRGFGSLAERADYMRTVSIMLPEKPFSGHGWGAFFYRHMKEKTTSTDESAHDPHNIFASFILHAGIPGGLPASAAVLLPLFILYFKRKELSALDQAASWGCLAFTLHCCCDINMQIPACLSGAGLLLTAALPEKKISSRHVPVFLRFIFLLLLGVFAFQSSKNILKADILYTRLVDMLHAPPDKAFSPEEILRQYQLVEKARPSYPFASTQMGDYWFARKEWTAAGAYYETALKRDPHRPAVYMRFAALALERFDEEQAEKFRQKAHELFPTHPKYKKLDKNP